MLENPLLDPSAFSRARNNRFRKSNIFGHIFERVVKTCLGAGLVGGEGFAVDASLIEADANRQRSLPGTEWKKQIDPVAASRIDVREANRILAMFERYRGLLNQRGANEGSANRSHRLLGEGEGQAPTNTDRSEEQD